MNSQKRRYLRPYLKNVHVHCLSGLQRAWKMLKPAGGEKVIKCNETNSREFMTEKKKMLLNHAIFILVPL